MIYKTTMIASVLASATGTKRPCPIVTKLTARMARQAAHPHRRLARGDEITKPNEGVDGVAKPLVSTIAEASENFPEPSAPLHPDIEARYDDGYAPSQETIKFFEDTRNMTRNYKENYEEWMNYENREDGRFKSITNKLKFTMVDLMCKAKHLDENYGTRRAEELFNEIAAVVKSHPIHRFVTQSYVYFQERWLKDVDSSEETYSSAEFKDLATSQARKDADIAEKHLIEFLGGQLSADKKKFEELNSKIRAIEDILSGRDGDTFKEEIQEISKKYFKNVNDKLINFDDKLIKEDGAFDEWEELKKNMIEVPQKLVEALEGLRNSHSELKKQYKEKIEKYELMEKDLEDLEKKLEVERKEFRERIPECVKTVAQRRYEILQDLQWCAEDEWQHNEDNQHYEAAREAVQATEIAGENFDLIASGWW